MSVKGTWQRRGEPSVHWGTGPARFHHASCLGNAFRPVPSRSAVIAQGIGTYPRGDSHDSRTGTECLPRPPTPEPEGSGGDRHKDETQRPCDHRTPRDSCRPSLLTPLPARPRAPAREGTDRGPHALTNCGKLLLSKCFLSHFLKLQ